MARTELEPLAGLLGAFVLVCAVVGFLLAVAGCAAVAGPCHLEASAGPEAPDTLIECDAGGSGFILAPLRRTP